MTSAHTIRIKTLDNDVQHHHHDHHQIVIGLSGHAEFDIEGHRGVIVPLSGCFVPANAEHYYAGLGENQQLIIDIASASPTLCGDNLNHRKLFQTAGFFSLDEPLRHYLSFIIEEIECSLHANQTLLIATLLSSLSSRVTIASSPVAAQRISRPLDVSKLEHFVIKKLNQRITVADLAGVACFSEAHFNQRFREQTGETPYQFVKRLRLTQARLLASHNELTLTAIAEQTGFSNQSALSHAFRRYFGYPPNHLRPKP